MALPVRGSEFVPLDRGTAMWVQIIDFGINPDLTDAALLASLIGSPGYVHDYASPYPSEPGDNLVPVHGRWTLSAVTADRFEPTTPERAELVLHRWANEQDWTVPGYRQPPEVEERLARVAALFRSGLVYVLRNPGLDEEHAYGFVTGGLGFHEFAVIDRPRAVLHSIVLSDD